MEQLQKLADTLNNHGFKAKVFQDRMSAAKDIVQLVGSGKTVGRSGSQTLTDLEISDMLVQNGCRVFYHEQHPIEEQATVTFAARTADYYLTSANAVSEDGELVYMDGRCNRISAVAYGPESVIIVISKNKIKLDLISAMKRVKEIAPLNAKRLGVDTPCAKLGKCVDCNHPKRMCNMMLIVERPSRGKTFYIYLINEELGY